MPLLLSLIRRYSIIVPISQIVWLTPSYLMSNNSCSLNYHDNRTIYRKNIMGGRLDNGTWTGEFGAYTGKDHVTMPSFNRASVMDDVDILRPIVRDRYYVFIRRDQIPKHSTVEWTTYVKPFEFLVWISIWLLTFFFILVELMIYLRLNLSVRNINEIIFSKFGRLCNQGVISDTNILTKSSSGKLLLIVFILFAQIMNASYSSCIISFLVSSTSTLAFNDIEGLLDFGGFTIHTFYDSPVRRMISRGSYDPIISRISEHFERNEKNLPYNRHESVYNMDTKKKYAFLQSEILGNYDFSTKPYKMIKFPVMKQTFFLSCFLNKYLPYQRFLNYKVLRLRETGVSQYLRKSIFEEEQIEEEKNTFNSVSIETIILPLFILLIFHLISIIFLIIEIFKSKRQRFNI